MNAASRLHALPRRQKGMALVTGLVLLLVIAMLALGGLKSTALSEKMAGNSRDQDVAFEAAENALRDGEQDAYANLTSTSAFTSGCASGLCLPSTSVTTQWDTVDWSASSTTTRAFGAYTNVGTYTGQSYQAPRYIVELLPDLPAGAGNGQGLNCQTRCTGTRTAFRITAVGWGRNAATQVMLQSIYVKQ